MIQTLLADDSPSFRAALAAVLGAAGGFRIVGSAGSGEDAIRLARELRPDLVVMDVLMPGLDGIAATARIMEDAPCAVVVMSTLLDAEAQQVVFRALEAGAVEALGKPKDLGSARVRQELVSSLQAMAAVKVVRRRRPGSERGALRRPEGPHPGPLLGPHPGPLPGGEGVRSGGPHDWRGPLPGGEGVRVVLLGASTGGPPALCEVLRHLPRSYPAAVVVAQHLAHGFAGGLARWLGEASGLPVRIVSGWERLQAGVVYLPADGHHIHLAQEAAIATPAPDESPVPSVNRLFDSAVGSARETIAVLLTGMGTDGAEALIRLKRAGAYTIVQDEASSLVWGMPRAGRELGAATEELGIKAVGPRLVDLAIGRSR